MVKYDVMKYAVKRKLTHALLLILCALLCLPAGGARAEETPSPQPEQTPAPEAAPVPVTDEQLDAGYLDSWFDGAVLVGDSLVAGLSGYVTNERAKKVPCLGNLTLVGASALSLKKALGCEKKERTGELKYRTRYMTISGVVEATEARRLFILLGVNDLRWYSAEELVDVYDQILSIVRANHPDVRIYVHSLMPMLKAYAKSVSLDYETHKAANEKLRAFCEEKGYTYLELADLVRDEEGYLRYEYSAQDYTFHLNSKGKAIWVRLLRECARDEYYQGIWKPEESAS